VVTPFCIRPQFCGAALGTTPRFEARATNEIRIPDKAISTTQIQSARRILVQSAHTEKPPEKAELATLISLSKNGG
jgi:hypothetical protein